MVSDRECVRHSLLRRGRWPGSPAWIACSLGLALACGNPAPEAATPPATGKAEIPAPATVASEISTDSWKTRSVEAGGYSIRFPPDAEATSGESPSTLLIELRNTVTVEGAEEIVGHGFRVSVHPNDKGQSSIEWAAERLIDPAPDFVRERESLLVGGLPAYRVAIFAFDQRDQYVVIARGPLIYELEWDEDVSIMPEELRNACRRVHEAMVASFRFLEASR